MATTVDVGVLQAILRLKDELSPALRSIGGTLSKSGASLKAVGAAATATALAMTPLALGVGKIAKDSVVAFANFESGMNRVRALTGATGKEFTELEAQAKQLGATTQFSASQAADAMGFLAMAGFSSNKIISAMPGVLQLAASAQIGLAEAADITSNVLTGYQLNVEELGRVNDVLTMSFTSANTDLTQLGQAFKFAGPVAASAGIQFEESAAILALMGNAGIQASMAGTSLRGSITRLLNPSKEAATILKEWGVNASESALRSGGLTTILEQMAPHAEETGKLMEVFGQRAGPAMAALLSQGTDSIRQLQTKLEGAGGVAERIAKIQMQGLRGAFIKLTSAAEGMFISIGQALAPMLLSVMDGLQRVIAFIQTTVIPAFNNLPHSVQLIILAFGAFIVIGPPLLALFGGLAAGIGAALGIIGPLVGGFTGFLAILAGVAAAVGTAIFAWEHWNEIMLLGETIWGLVKMAVQGIILIFQQLWNILSPIAVFMMQFNPLWIHLVATLAAVDAAVNYLTGGLVDFSTTLSNLNLITDAAKIAWLDLQSAFASVTIVALKAKRALTFDEKEVENINAQIAGLQDLKKEFEGKIDAVVRGTDATAALNEQEKESGGLFKEISNAVKKVGAAFDNLGGGVSDTSDKIETMAERVERFKKSLIEADLDKEARAMAEFAIHGAEIEDFIPSLSDLADEMGDLADNMDELDWEGAFPDEVIGGLPAATLKLDAFNESLKNMAQTIVGALQGGGDIFKSIGSSLLGGLGSDLGNFFGQKGGILGQLGKFLPGIGGLLGGSLGGMVDKLFGGLFGGGEEVQVNDLRDAFFEAQGGFVALQEKLVGLTNQDLVKKIFDAETVEDFNAAVAETMGVLNTQQAAQEALNDAVQRYGFSIEELGPKYRQQELDKMAGQLLQDFQLLTASGIEQATVLEKMAPSMNEYINTALAAGTAIPEAMRGPIESLLEMGLLTDAEGNPFTSLEESGLQFTESLTDGLGRVIESIDRLVAALTGVQPVNVPVTFTTQGNVPGMRPGEFDSIPGVPGFASGSGGFKNFGAGTLAMLHGTEGVFRPEDIQSMTKQVNVTLAPVISPQMAVTLQNGDERSAENLARSLSPLLETEILRLAEQAARAVQEGG